MSTFPIRRVKSDAANAFEALGSKPKFWFVEDKKRLLFKAEDRGTGEDWAEVVSCHLCELLGLPHVEYELAAEYQDEEYRRPGVVCENMASSPISLMLGNQLLLAIDSDYPAARRFKVRQHTIDAVVEIVRALDPPDATWLGDVPSEIETALDVFTGYVMLDAWIANQDRHHENWGALCDGQRIWLAPTFDHGAALARNLTDRERAERLATRDRNRTIGAFAKAARSAFYGSTADTRPLGTLEAFRSFGREAPGAAKTWLDRLGAVKPEAIYGILEGVPPERMSETCRRFTLELLKTNQQRLLE
ncbi:MAG: phosphatidylinositol kinase [Pirellulaceae bacterium]|nr:phosphatidylinositol kinase [Pirellulaceae bacterium]